MNFYICLTKRTSEPTRFFDNSNTWIRYNNKKKIIIIYGIKAICLKCSGRHTQMSFPSIWFFHISRQAYNFNDTHRCMFIRIYTYVGANAVSHFLRKCIYLEKILSHSYVLDVGDNVYVIFLFYFTLPIHPYLGTGHHKL